MHHETLVFLTAGILMILPSIVRDSYPRFRRILDAFAAALAMALTSPLVAVAALLIKLDSPGPAILKQVRVGVNRRREARRGDKDGGRRARDNYGRPFVIYKLRTMYEDAEKGGPLWTSEHDARITKVGRILRKMRIDEIPQFINVLQGNMSIIGPRPERPVFVSDLNTGINGYVRRFDITPGITGLAQVKYKYAASIEDTRKKLQYDLFYIDKMCLMLDAGILLLTLGTILYGKGAR